METSTGRGTLEAGPAPLRRDFTPRSRERKVTYLPSSGVVVQARPAVLRVAAGAVLSEVQVPEAEDGESATQGASVDEFLRRSAEQQHRLRAEIRAAHQRIEAAATPPAGATDAGAELAALVYDAHAELARLEREHQEAIQAIRDRALAEAARLIDDARRRAAEVRTRAGRLIEGARGDADGGDSIEEEL